MFLSCTARSEADPRPYPLVNDDFLGLSSYAKRLVELIFCVHSVASFQNPTVLVGSADVDRDSAHTELERRS